MFFFMAKVLGFLVVPSNALALCGAVGAVISWRPCWRLWGIRLMGGAALLTLLIGLSPLGDWLTVTLEERFPRTRLEAGSPPTGFIILGGMIDPDLGAGHGEISLNDAAERVVVVAELSRRFPTSRIVFSGGDATLFGTGHVEAEMAQRLLLGFGIDEVRITLELRARDTYENAVFSRDLLRPLPGERWILITSASHMPRAMGCFRAAGFSIEPYPVDYRTAGGVRGVLPLRNVAGGMRGVDAAVREWIGLVVYRLRNRTTALFPGP